MPNDEGLEYSVVGTTVPLGLSRMSTYAVVGSTGSRDRSETKRRCRKRERVPRRQVNHHIRWQRRFAGAWRHYRPAGDGVRDV